jgi:hypothetical protein
MVRVLVRPINLRGQRVPNVARPSSGFLNGGDACREDSVTVRSQGCVHLRHHAAQSCHHTLTMSGRWSRLSAGF